MNRQIQVMIAGHAAKMEEGRSTFKILTGKQHTGKKYLLSPRRI